MFHLNLVYNLAFLQDLNLLAKNVPSWKLESCGLQLHETCLSCCGVWYGRHGICCNFVLRKTWHPEYLFSKIQKKNIEVPQMMINSYQSHMMIYIAKPYSYAICYHIELCQIVVTFVRLLSCTHDRDSRAPRYKHANSYTESYAKTCNPSTKNKLHPVYHDISLKNIQSSNNMGHAK